MEFIIAARCWLFFLPATHQTRHVTSQSMEKNSEKMRLQAHPPNTNIYIWTHIYWILLTQNPTKITWRKFFRVGNNTHMRLINSKKILKSEVMRFCKRIPIQIKKCMTICFTWNITGNMLVFGEWEEKRIRKRYYIIHIVPGRWINRMWTRCKQTPKPTAQAYTEMKRTNKQQSKWIHGEKRAPIKCV